MIAHSVSSIFSGEGGPLSSRDNLWVLPDPGKSLGLQTEHYCSCSASRLKKEPRGSDRDLSGLMDGGSYRSEARAWRDSPPCVVHSGQDVAAAFAMGAAEGREVLPL